MFHLDAGAIVGMLLIVVGLPLVTTVITGGICGVKMAGLNWWGGMMIGVACAFGTVIGMAITNAWFDLDSYISIFAYGIALLVSAAALTAALCYLWAFLVGRRSYWWRI